MDIFGFIKEDWKKVPQNNRYLILSGATLIFIDWFTDHWGKSYSYFGKDYHQWFFNLGITFILIGIVMMAVLMLIKQFFALSIMTNYRTIYPIDKVNETFSLVLFKGRMILFDKRDSNKKRAYHVATSNTAIDLGFWGSENSMDM